MLLLLASVMWHSTAEELGGYGWGLQALVGFEGAQ